MGHDIFRKNDYEMQKGFKEHVADVKVAAEHLMKTAMMAKPSCHFRAQATYDCWCEGVKRLEEAVMWFNKALSEAYTIDPKSEMQAENCHHCGRVHDAEPSDAESDIEIEVLKANSIEDFLKMLEKIISKKGNKNV